MKAQPQSHPPPFPVKLTTRTVPTTLYRSGASGHREKERKFNLIPAAHDFWAEQGKKKTKNSLLVFQMVFANSKPLNGTRSQFPFCLLTCKQFLSGQVDVTPFESMADALLTLF